MSIARPVDKHDSGMTLKRLLAMTPDKRWEWLGSDEHSVDCAAHSEGQWCCLEKLFEDYDT